MPHVSATTNSRRGDIARTMKAGPVLAGRPDDSDSAEFTDWPLSKRKRIFDVLASASLLLILTPLMLLIALLIKSTSRGPVLFCRGRVGHHGQIFPMLKFRSMVHGCDGPQLTCKGDERVTFVGKILRKFKLDELPQVINVLQGHMSMVGPRPHLPEVFAFRPEYEQFLRLRPGITGAATVRFHREEETLKPMPWAELRQFYIDTILPEKVRMEMEYARGASFWTDLRLIVMTASRAFVPIHRKHARVETTLAAESKPHAVEARPEVVAESSAAAGEEYAA